MELMTLQIVGSICIPPRKNGKVKEEEGLEERNFAIEIASLFGGGEFVEESKRVS